MKRVIIRQLLCQKEQRLLSKNKNIGRELQSLQQDGSYNGNRSYIYIYFIRDSLQMLVFRDYFETRGHPSSTPPFVRLRETIFLEDPFQGVEAILGGHLLFRCGK